MDKEQILQLVNEHKDSFVQIIKARDKEFYSHISSKFTGRSFSEKLYKWNNDVSAATIGKCEVCGKDTNFLTFGEGYRTYCSIKCANMASAPSRSGSRPMNMEYWEEIECLACKTKFFALKFRKRVYCSNKCSCAATANDSSRLNKIRETKLERYGNETYVNPEKAKETCKLRYGVDNASKSDIILDKIKTTNNEKYGVDWSFQLGEVKDKIKQTNLVRYGVENASSSNVVKNKRIRTYMERYGVNNPFRSKEVMQKVRVQYKQKFGVEYPSLIEEVRKQIHDTTMMNNYSFLQTHQRGMSKVEFLFPPSEYNGADYDKLYKVKCIRCGNIFEDHFDGNGHPRCLICHPNISGFSLAEKEIEQYIRGLLPTDVTIICRDRTILKNRELDIYIPSKKIAIEYDGLFWHGEVGGKKPVEYHLDKLERCEKEGIRLITIFEDEWKEKENIVKSKIRHILYANTSEKIGARKCHIEEISKKQSNIFLNKHHIQGSSISKINLGLFDESGNIIAVMTFGSPRIIMGMHPVVGEYELIRYASSKCVIGGASKLFSYFIKKYNPSNVISYADRRWSTTLNNTIYNILNFKMVSISPPSHWYFRPGYPIRYHSSGCRKHIVGDKVNIVIPLLTEWENMQLNGWDRIWDCGHLKYEWKEESIIS